ncbi:MAG: chorismate-binding protein, partial [Mycobacterium sp.]
MDHRDEPVIVAMFHELADLSPAGPAHTGTALVGASPELLVARRGEEVTCRPFAGSAPRSADPRADDAAGAALAASAK